MAVPALIMGGASILGGLFGGNSAKKAARAQADAQNAATAESRRQFDTSLSLTAPWRQEGQNALYRMGNASSGNLNDFYNSAQYKVALPEGNKTLGNSFAARGGAFSGNALRALSDYGAQQFGNWWDQQARVAGLGQQTAGQNATNAIQTGQMVGNNMVGAGDARASGVMGNANSILGGVNNALNMYAMTRPTGGNYWGMGSQPVWSSFYDYSGSGMGPGPWAPGK